VAMALHQRYRRCRRSSALPALASLSIQLLFFVKAGAFPD